MSNWLIPKEIEENYLERCEYYAANDFSNFKRDKKYNTILEGNELDVAKIAYRSIERLNGVDILKKNLDKFKENESVGNPELVNYKGLEIAPSTLRYVNTALEIKTLVDNPKKIIEIGGGYGGLCKIMSVLNKWDSYTILDCPPAVKLTNKYLKHFNLNAQAFDSYEEQGCDLLIADSSLSECNIETQLQYAELVKRANYAYIVYNTLFTRNGIENFKRFLGELILQFDIRLEHTRNDADEDTSTIVIMYLKRNFKK